MDLQTLKTMHPSWNLVDFKMAPNGGIWALGADGGVFSLDSGGGTAGTVAPFQGSYTALDPTQRQGNRSFVRLDLNPAGGYTLVSNNQEQYNFNPPPAPNPLTAPPPINTTNTQQATGSSPAVGQSLSASAAIHAVFDPLGLGGLADSALNYLNSTPGATPEYVTQVWLPQQDVYKQTFPEIGRAQAQVAAGKNVAIPDPATIVAYRQAAQQMVTQGLVPPELVSNDKIGDLILGGTSLGEFENRVMKGWSQLQNAPDDLQAFLAYHPGLDASHAVAALLDPTLGDQAAQNAITQAQIGGAAVRAGFGNLTAAQATSLQQAGLSGPSAQRALGQEALLDPLTQNLVGEQGNLTKDTLVGDVAGNKDAMTAVANRRAARQALFGGGGGAAAGSSGATGLGGS